MEKSFGHAVASHKEIEEETHSLLQGLVDYSKSLENEQDNGFLSGFVIVQMKMKNIHPTIIKAVEELLKDYNPYSRCSGLNKTMVSKYIKLLLEDDLESADAIIDGLPSTEDLPRPVTYIDLSLQKKSRSENNRGESPREIERPPRPLSTKRKHDVISEQIDTQIGSEIKVAPNMVLSRECLVSSASPVSTPPRTPNLFSFSPCRSPRKPIPVRNATAFPALISAQSGSSLYGGSGASSTTAESSSSAQFSSPPPNYQFLQSLINPTRSAMYNPIMDNHLQTLVGMHSYPYMNVANPSSAMNILSHHRNILEQQTARAFQMYHAQNSMPCTQDRLPIIGFESDAGDERSPQSR